MGRAVSAGPRSSQHRMETLMSQVRRQGSQNPGGQLTVTRRLASMEPRPDARVEDARVSLFSSRSTRLPKSVATASLLGKASRGQEPDTTQDLPFSLTLASNHLRQISGREKPCAAGDMFPLTPEAGHTCRPGRDGGGVSSSPPVLGNSH